MSTDAPAVDLPALTLPDDVETLQRMIRELLVTLHSSQQRNDKLAHQLDQLLRRLYGPRAERIDPRQLSLFEPPPAEPEPAVPPPVEPPSARPATRVGHGRRRLPESLPRRQVVHELSAAQRGCPCCGALRTKIGQEISEQLEYEPASLYVIEHVRLKYACRTCQEQVQTAEKPPQPIERGLPGPGLLAWTTLSKHAYHQPLYRQEKFYAHHGLSISRSTTCDWMAACARLCEPLYDLMVAEILQSKAIHTDDTPVRALAGGNHALAYTGRFWVYVGDNRHPYTAFQFTPNRSRAGPLDFLDQYQGYLQADAYAGYDELFRTRPIVEVGCWMHARRYFYEAKESDPARAHYALAEIRRLYDVERAAKEFSSAQRQTLRERDSAPVLHRLREWLTTQQPHILPKSPLGKAVHYALANWKALTRYTTDGDLNIDNGAAERPLRAVALGRKNWLFVGSENGGRTAAILFSILASIQRAAIDPFLYLRDLYRRLPTTPNHEIPQLLPNAWTPIN